MHAQVPRMTPWTEARGKVEKKRRLPGGRLPIGIFLGSQASYLSISPIEFPQDLLRIYTYTHTHTRTHTHDGDDSRKNNI